MSRIGKYSLLLVFAGLLAFGNTEKAHSQEVDYRAYTLFLYNFMKYVEWPSTEGDFIIGVVGDSPVKKELEQLAKTKKAKGKQIVVISISTPGDVSFCNMVYIPSDRSSELKQILEKAKNKSVLVVAEREGMAKKGAGISFVIDDDDALKFDINKSALDSHSLKIASMLIKLGFLVG